MRYARSIVLSASTRPETPRRVAPTFGLAALFAPRAILIALSVPANPPTRRNRGVSRRFILDRPHRSSYHLFPNREGKVDEVGVKLELWDNRVIATASWFDIRLTNALGSFPDDDGSVTGIPGFSYQAPLGEATNEGYEVDVAFEPINGLSLLASWSDLEALTEIGRRQRNAPQRTYSLFGSYRFSTGSLKGLSFGGGFHRVEDRAWDSRDTGSLPDYTVGQMFIRYSREAWDVQLNIDNVADIIYYGGSTANTTMAFMDPRTYSFQFRYRF